MSSPDRPIRLNRTLLAVCGLVLLTAGGFGLAARLGSPRLVAPAAPLVPGPGATDLVISVEQGGDLTAIRQRVHDEGLPRLRQALETDHIPVTMEFRFTTHPTGTHHRCRCVGPSSHSRCVDGEAFTGPGP